MSEKKLWYGETTCDLCHHEITDTLYDAAVRYVGFPWATMCEKCYKKHGVKKLGQGFGQKYVKNVDGEFEKVEG